MSGVLALMLGSGGAPDIQGGTASRTTATTATASYTLTTAGLETLVGLGTTSRTWISGGASAYDVRATLTSGAVSTGTTGSWLSMASDRAWSCAQATIGIKQAVLTVEIRNASTLAVVDTATVNLYAEVTP